MNDFDVLQNIKDDILQIKNLLKERNIIIISKHYSEFKEKLREMHKSLNSNFSTTSYVPKAISEILHKSLSANKNSKDISKIALCMADAHSYIDYYLGQITMENK